MYYRSKTIIFSLVILLFTVVIFVSCTQESHHTPHESVTIQQVNDAPTMLNHLGDSIPYTRLSEHTRIQDFFFTSCPSICPKMSASMLRIQSAIESNSSNIKLYSISIDPKRDSLPVLRRYAEKLGSNDTIWQFLRGEKQEIYSWGNQFQAAIEEDSYAPGGFMHSGALSVVSENGTILGIFDGTVDQEVDELIQKFIVK